MVTVSKEIIVNVGSFQSVRIGVQGADSFEECDRVIMEEMKRLNFIDFHHPGVGK